MDKDTANIAVHTFVTSKLDYGNVLLFGLPASHSYKLQFVQYDAARVVVKIRNYAKIIEICQQLHRFHIKASIDFKILLLIWKTLHWMAPRFISDLSKKNECN